MPLYGTGYPLLAPDGTAVAPSYAFATSPTSGWYFASGAPRLSVSGVLSYTFSASVITFTSGSASIVFSDTIFCRDDAINTLAMRSGTAAQTLRGYFSYTDAGNYARWALKTASGVVEFAAETAGTGADDIDVLLTPAGTGNVRFGTYGAEVALVAGYVTIKDAGGTPRKLAVIA